MTTSTLSPPKPLTLDSNRVQATHVVHRPARGIRVLHVLPAFFGGGMERFLAALIDKNTADGACRDVQHGVCILRDADPALMADLNTDMPVWVLGRANHRRDYGCWRRLRQIVRAYQPDIVEALSTGAWMDATLATRGLRGVRLLLGFHGRTDLNRPSWPRRWANHWTTRHADGVFAVSADAARMLAEDWRLPADKLHVLPNGLDIQRFHPAESETVRLQLREQLGLADAGFVAICVANLMPIKLLPDLVRAWAALPPADARAHLLIVGDGPLHAELEELARQAGCSTWVHFLGSRKDVPLLLQAADVFVLSSAYEACSLAVLEAMATALPVIATAVGGLPELIEPGETGWLVPPRAVQQLTFALRTAIAGPETRRRLGKTARAWVEKQFSLQACRHRYLHLYAELATPASTAARKEQRACAE